MIKELFKDRCMRNHIYCSSIHYFSNARPLKQILHCSKDSKRKRKYNVCWFDCKLDGSIQFFVKESLEKHFFELFSSLCVRIYFCINP